MLLPNATLVIISHQPVHCVSLGSRQVFLGCCLHGDMHRSQRNLLSLEWGLRFCIFSHLSNSITADDTWFLLYTEVLEKLRSFK